MLKAIKESAEHIQFVKVDGLPNIARSKHYLVSILWTVLLITNAGLCVWLIVETYRQYDENRVTTSIRQHHEESSIFPTVTVCNTMPFTSEYAADLWQKAGIVVSPVPTDEINYHYFYQIQQYMLTTRGYYLTKYELFNLTDFETMLISCIYNGIVCDSSDFEPIFHPSFYNCYRFNSNGSKKSTVSGQSGRLRLIMYTGLPYPMNEPYHVASMYQYKTVVSIHMSLHRRCIQGNAGHRRHVYTTENSLQSISQAIQ